MIRRLPRALALLAVPLALAAGACAEQLDTGDGCPLLCPGQAIDIRDTVLDPAIVLDTSLTGYPLLGYETPLMLISRGDTLDVRPIIRFDTLTRFYLPAGAVDAVPVTSVDSATLRVRLLRAGLKVPNTFFVDAYDVGDTLLVDSLPQTLLPFFDDPARLMGSLQVDSAQFVDSLTIAIPLDTAKLRAIVQGGNVLRLGLRLRGAETGAFFITSSDDFTAGPRLRYRVSSDTTIPVPLILPSSSTPRVPATLNADYADYVVIARARDPRAADRFSVGGLPATRSYLRFDIPAWLTDSVGVLRAQLELTQDPVRGLDETDSMTVRVQLVLAGNVTTDLNQAARLLAPTGTFVTDSVRRAPADSGLVRVEINALVRSWRNNAGLPDIPQAVVLRADFEGISGSALRFFGRNAPAGVRPRLRVSYVPNIRFGQP